VGSSIASVLAAAGVGRVDVVDTGRVEAWDAAPCGTAASERGRQRSLAARAAVRRAAPGSAARGLALRGSEVRLVVLAPRDGLSAFAPDPAESRALVEARVPHLYTGVVEDMGFVGPLVLPWGHGPSACGECLVLGQTRDDPAWPRVLAQLRSGRPGPVPACDTALATAVAGLAGLHALILLDGGVPPSVGGRMGVHLKDLSVAENAVSPHPDCGCGAARTSVGGSIGHAPAATGEVQVTMEAG
jgi:hypothetical protein